MGTNEIVRTYRVWPSDWRVVHTVLSKPENAQIIFAPVLDRGELFIDGDCGWVWGEPKIQSCKVWHIQFYGPSDVANEAVGLLQSDALDHPTKEDREGRNFWVCVTDPNDWSEKVNAVKWTNKTQPCPNH